MSAKVFTDEEGKKYELVEAIHVDNCLAIKPQEPQRWRAEYDEKYFYVNADCRVIGTREYFTDADTFFHRVGNYFRTKEQAEAAAEAVRALFVNIQGPLELDAMNDYDLCDAIDKTRKTVQENK
jgi:hypothetical protein